MNIFDIAISSAAPTGVPDRIPLDRIKSFLEANPVFTAKLATEVDKQCYVIEVDV